jgi:hypothetical protein
MVAMSIGFTHKNTAINIILKIKVLCKEVEEEINKLVSIHFYSLSLSLHPPIPSLYLKSNFFTF